ncbi:unnamed protein product [Auanema sp. JU1783]|nr:unnamed protein product [Auanema sp. JU1783]
MAIGTMTKSLVHLYRELTAWGFGLKESRKVAVTKFMNYICAQLVRERLEKRFFMPFTAEERRCIMSCKYYFGMRIKTSAVCPEMNYAQRVSMREALGDLLHHWIFFGPGKNMRLAVRPDIIFCKVYTHHSRLRKVYDGRRRGFSV